MMALGNFQKELLMGGKTNLVGDQELFNTASEISKLMGHKNADKFFNDPKATDPKTGKLLHPPVQPPPDPKLQVEQMKQQGKQQEVAHKAQLDQQKAQTDAMHQQMKAAADIEIAKVKAELDAKIAIVEAHVKMVVEEQKMRHANEKHQLDTKAKALDMVATAHQHDSKMEQTSQSHEAKLEQMKKAPKPKGGK